MRPHKETYTKYISLVEVLRDESPPGYRWVKGTFHWATDRPVEEMTVSARETRKYPYTTENPGPGEIFLWSPPGFRPSAGVRDVEAVGIPMTKTVESDDLVQWKIPLNGPEVNFSAVFLAQDTVWVRLPCRAEEAKFIFRADGARAKFHVFAGEFTVDKAKSPRAGSPEGCVVHATDLAPGQGVLWRWTRMGRPRAAYEAFSAQVGGRSLVTGEKLPEWWDLSDAEVTAWQAATRAACQP